MAEQKTLDQLPTQSRLVIDMVENGAVLTVLDPRLPRAEVFVFERDTEMPKRIALAIENALACRAVLNRSSEMEG